MNAHELETELSLPIQFLVTNAIRLIRADKELCILLSAIKHGAVRQDAWQSVSSQSHALQPEVRLAQAGLIVRIGSDSWGLTDLGQQVSAYLSQYEADEELALMYDHLEIKENSVLVDLGCGAGPALMKACELPTPPRLLIGIDIDRLSLIAAREWLAPHQSRCLMVQADLAALPIKAEVISHVCSRLSMPYVSQHAAVAELGRVLGPGGRVFLQLHGPMFYVRLLRAECGTWKRMVMNIFCLVNGFLFWCLGIQLRIPRPEGVYQELYQTDSGIARLLKRHLIEVRWHEHAQLFRLLGWKR